MSTISKQLIHDLRAHLVCDLKASADLFCTSYVPANIEPSVVASTSISSTTDMGSILLISIGMHLAIIDLIAN